MQINMAELEALLSSKHPPIPLMRQWRDMVASFSARVVQSMLEAFRDRLLAAVDKCKVPEWQAVFSEGAYKEKLAFQILLP